MSIPTDEQLTGELKRLYMAAHPGEPEPYLEVEEALPERILYFIRIGSDTYDASISIEDMMSGSLDYIGSILLKRHVKAKAVT